MDATARAKPLNALTLAALPVAVAALEEEIRYLDDALEAINLRSDKTVNGSPFAKKLTAKRDALVRSREWLQSKIDSEKKPDA